MSLLTPNRKAVIVAMDHGRTHGFIEGLESPGAVIDEVVEAGADAIMTTFGIKTSAQLKALYVDALVEQGKVKAIGSSKSRVGRPAKKVNTVKVNQRGSLVVPKELIEEFGFKVGDSFTVRKTKAGVAAKLD